MARSDYWAFVTGGVSTNLHLEPIFRQAKWAGHDACIQDQIVQPGLLLHLSCEVFDAGKVCQVELKEPDHILQLEGGQHASVVSAQPLRPPIEDSPGLRPPS